MAAVVVATGLVVDGGVVVAGVMAVWVVTAGWEDAGVVGARVLVLQALIIRIQTNKTAR